MMKSLCIVDLGHSPICRGSFRYRNRNRKYPSLQEAVELASVARQAGGPVVVAHRHRRCDATDASGLFLFLIGISPGDVLGVEVAGPTAATVLRDIEQLLERTEPGIETAQCRAAMFDFDDASA